MLTPQQFCDYIYNSLPNCFRVEDSMIQYPLKRYLSAICAGGYAPVIDGINDMKALIDPYNCPEEFFPLLYESFGLTYYEDVDISYQRKILSNIGELTRRRGTYGAVRYLTRVLTLHECELRYVRGKYLDRTGKFLFIDLLADDLQEMLGLDVQKTIVEAFISQHVPYSITPIVGAKIRTHVLQIDRYQGFAMNEFKGYDMSLQRNILTASNGNFSKEDTFWLKYKDVSTPNAQVTLTIRDDIFYNKVGIMKASNIRCGIYMVNLGTTALRKGSDYKMTCYMRSDVNTDIYIGYFGSVVSNCKLVHVHNEWFRFSMIDTYNGVNPAVRIYSAENVPVKIEIAQIELREYL